MKGSKRERQPRVWELRVHAGPDPLTGRPRYISKTFHGGTREANSELARLVATAADATAVDSRAPFSVLLDSWLEQLVSLGRSPSTLRGYRSKIETAIRPALGAIRLDALSPTQLDRFYRARIGRGDAPRSVISMHRIIHACLEQGIRWGWIEVNPAARATPPTAAMREISAPSPDELQEIVNRAANGRQPEWANLLLFLALTGMRRGELCGLHWSDVEIDEGRFTIRRSILDIGGLVERQPKTGRVRRIALGDLGTSLLIERRKFAEKVAAEVGAELSPDAYVWSLAEDGLSPLKPISLTQYFSRLVVQCGYMTTVGQRSKPKYSLHSLRHFSATQLVGANVDVRTVSSRTGHADATTVLRVYAHAIEQRDLEAANILGHIIDRDGSFTKVVHSSTP